MELFFQFTGPSASDALLLDREKTYVYSSPRERTIDRCGVLANGAYFACSELLYIGDSVWMKIRRGAFSNAAQTSGYVRVEFEFDDQLAPKQRRCTAFHISPRRFKHLVQLPSFPTFLCARERITLSRMPSFDALTPPLPLASHARQLPPASVFHATERRFNDDFSQLAIKISSPFGLSGWINASFADLLVEVEDPRQPLTSPVLVQNIASRTGKWQGELPVRALPTLQAERRGMLESFRIAAAVERKLVKDHVWLRLRSFTSDNNQTADEAAAADEAWIIERHANSGERVVVPWGADSIHDASLARDDYTERYYRNIYGSRVLPLRKEPRLQSDVVGELAPGTVVVSTRRVLNENGHVWIRIALSDATTTANPQDVTYGYAIQSSAKTNVCMLQEVSPPGKMAPKQHFQVILQQRQSSEQTSRRVAARAAPSSTSEELFYLRHGTVISAIGSVFNSDQKAMWLQALRQDIDPVMIEEKPRLPHEQREHDDGYGASNNQGESDVSVVYLPVCFVDPGCQHESALLSIGRVMQRGVDPSNQDSKRTAASVVNTGGRASKLFGSQLMRPSTIDVADMPVKATAPVAARAAGEDPAQALKDEINAWQSESVASGVYSVMQRTKTALAACVQRPFAACLQRSVANKMYSQLHQNEEEEEDEDEEMAYGRRRP